MLRSDIEQENRQRDADWNAIEDDMQQDEVKDLKKELIEVYSKIGDKEFSKIQKKMGTICKQIHYRLKEFIKTSPSLNTDPTDNLDNNDSDSSQNGIFCINSDFDTSDDQLASL